jgi:hypothetical protein
VTARLQASGQSKGQAVSTIDAGPPSTASRPLRSSFPGEAMPYDTIKNATRGELSIVDFRMSIDRT